MKTIVCHNIEEHFDMCQKIGALNEIIVECAQWMITTLKGGGRIFFCGNGGSAADAQHLAAELSGRYLMDRRPLDAVAFHCNTSALTAIANDFGYDWIFTRQLQAHGREGDLLVAISTSGNSPNVIKAVEKAAEMRIKTVALTGEKGAVLAKKCDLAISVPSIATPRIQEMHILIGHTLCEIVEKELFQK